MITQSERDQIRQMLSEGRWRTAERIANDICDKIAYQSKVRDTEWDTLKTTLIDEGKIIGIKDFIKELYNQAQQ